MEVESAARVSGTNPESRVPNPEGNGLVACCSSFGIMNSSGTRCRARQRKASLAGRNRVGR
jgi:hypothetical protein